MKTHELKTIQPFYDDVLFDRKPFEVIRDDRDFKVGDTLLLNEFINETHTGKQIAVSVTYKLPGGQFGIETGYCVLGTKKIKPL